MLSNNTLFKIPAAVYITKEEPRAILGVTVVELAGRGFLGVEVGAQKGKSTTTANIQSQKKIK